MTRMTDYQRDLVEEHMHIVDRVIGKHFDVKGGEPTEGYIIFSRCMGIFGIIVGIRVLIVYIVK